MTKKSELAPGVVRRPMQQLEEGRRETREDELAVEEPLEIQLGYVRKGWRVHKSVSITMRTPGDDSELAVGFLFAEGILNGLACIQSLSTPADNTIRVDLRADVAVDLRGMRRNFCATSSCGVCGKASMTALQVSTRRFMGSNGSVFSAGRIHGLPAKLRATQDVFDRTGGLHAAGLFDGSGQLLCRREDVGRHNAVDKLIGSRLLAGEEAPFDRTLLLVSGRASFELMQKTIAAGIPILAAVGAPSSLAVDMAMESGATLLGFVRDGRFNIYAGVDRIVP